ncbi:hypothetical protein HO173_007918 [Letharia columbiana]|uniref:Uncharacterized protein n=1 Tax=Letharia columbiana TaxID=112416 RepID=A0A8H6FS54_9LECA|nr:uncharacterized protein HO173_007918 [Letharia columbiana]KAF6233706.1 hypothetical protein HO173_007918 [Letharia columbiana]
MSQDSVSACVASLSSVYHNGAELVQQIIAKRRSRNTFQDASIDVTAQELESSLNRGESTVRNQYERTYKRCGDAFAQGDQLARDALQDIITHHQGQVFANLKAQLEQDTFVDFIALQDICDSSQDRAILVLMQLQQRTISLGPIETLPLNPLSKIGRLSSPPQNAAQPSRQNTSSITVSSSPNTSSANGNILHVRKMSLSPSIRPITPPSTPNTSQYSPRSDSARGSRERTSTDRRDAAQYKPMATTVTTTGLFGIGKRTKVEPVVSPPENPLVDEYLAVAIEDANNGLSSNASIRSRTNSISTAVSSIYEPDHPAFNSWQDYQATSPALSQKPTDSILSFDTVRHAPSHRFSGSIKSFDSQRRASAATVETLSSNKSICSINPKDPLPSEMNKYAGFCKGAWRQQIGDRKRALEERVRPGGMYNAAKYYQCKQCKFEGRLIPIDKKKSGFDMRVFKLVQGIQFRWEFMFKSHIQVKEACSDPTKATFGCIFCCAEGRGTPMFGGIQTFMNHLVEHREHFPTGEVLYRMNCLVGRQAAIDEDFDINIISIEGGKI